MKLKALIVDDEQEVATALRLILQKTCPNIEVTNICLSVIEGVKALKKNPVDIIFLDIEMSGGNGFDLMEILGDEIPYVIFSTAHSEYAIKAVKAGAKDYLLKPIDPDELIAAVEKATTSLNKTQVKSKPSTISVNSTNGIIFLNKEDIVYIKADGRYSEIHCRDERSYTICKNIGEYEDELASDFFFRVHKSYLINCKHVVKIKSTDGGFVEMINLKEIEISKRKKTEFLKIFK